MKQKQNKQQIYQEILVTLSTAKNNNNVTTKQCKQYAGSLLLF